MRNQIDLGIFNFGVFLQIYQMCFLFLCNQVLGRESIHNGLESVDNDRFFLAATPTQHCTCNTFYEKPNVTRASILKKKSYYKIMAIGAKSLLNAYQCTYNSVIFF